MAHVFEKVIYLSVISNGAKIGFSCGDTLKLKDVINFYLGYRLIENNIIRKCSKNI